MKFRTQILKKSYDIDLANVIKNALKEDIPRKDITSEMLIPETSISEAIITAKENGILCGTDILRQCFKLMDNRMNIRFLKKDGNRIRKGDVILKLKGKTKAILEAERTALNFLQHLSGIATYTNKMVLIAKKYNVTVLDTRKTIPGLRHLAKYAVQTGGGKNHRLHLSDEILIKENHIVANGGIEKTLQKIRKCYKQDFEVEVENLNELKSALDHKVKYILLDNFSLSDMKKAASINNGRAKLEASGGVNLKNISKIASTGINFISVGAVTHSAPALDFSLILVR
ncbi:MAG: carboxylating nicotinate-nucleotide diphosphorylase [Spirochaetes bacterium]|nr:carboxylating nicotinate-nucleotide diphosphorylase [Spirochaetota bacterium]